MSGIYQVSSCARTHHQNLCRLSLTLDGAHLPNDVPYWFRAERVQESNDNLGLRLGFMLEKAAVFKFSPHGFRGSCGFKCCEATNLLQAPKPPKKLKYGKNRSNVGSLEIRKAGPK